MVRSPRSTTGCGKTLTIIRKDLLSLQVESDKKEFFIEAHYSFVLSEASRPLQEDVYGMMLFSLSNSGYRTRGVQNDVLGIGAKKGLAHS